MSNEPQPATRHPTTAPASDSINVDLGDASLKLWAQRTISIISIASINEGTAEMAAATPITKFNSTGGRYLGAEYYALSTQGTAAKPMFPRT